MEKYLFTKRKKIASIKERGWSEDACNHVSSGSIRKEQKLHFGKKALQGAEGKLIKIDITKRVCGIPRSCFVQNTLSKCTQVRNYGKHDHWLISSNREGGRQYAKDRSGRS